MTIIQAIISGIVQGLTEFLPVSSSGHLVILHRYFGLQEPQVFFNICLHIGTLGAIIFVFRKEIIALKRWKSGLVRALIFASLSTAIIGIFLANFSDRLFGSIRLVGAMLLVTAFWLALGTLALRKKGGKSIAPNQWQALIIGAAQGIALIPGISRSGATISTALMLKGERNLAVYFSFLISIPATLGALFYQLKTPLLIDSLSPTYITNILVGTAVAFVVGLIALKAVLKAVGKNRLYLFSIYCFLIGGAVLILG